MVRGTKGPGGKECLFAFQSAKGRIDLSGLQAFVRMEGGKDGGEALGQHGFPGSRWPQHQQVVSSSSGDYKGPFGIFLTANIGKVKWVLVQFFETILPQDKPLGPKETNRLSG